MGNEGGASMSSSTSSFDEVGIFSWVFDPASAMSSVRLVDQNGNLGIAYSGTKG